MEILNQKLKKGFTLVEAAIALLILSVIAGVAIVLIPHAANVQLDAKNEQKLDKLQNALLAFYNANGYLPCPASRTEAYSSANYGVSTNCFTTSATGTIDTDSGTGANSVRIGVIPSRSLGLMDADLLDEYGNRYTYAVLKDLTKSQAIFNNYINTAQNLVVNDSNNNMLNQSGDVLAFVIVSNGENGFGAYNTNGVLVSTCSGSSKDVENCNDDKIFREQFKNFESGPNYFDDSLRWLSISQVQTLGKGNFLSSQALNFQYAYLSRLINPLANLSAGNFGSTLPGSGQWVNKLTPTTVNFNTILGSTINTASGIITLPAGTYYVKASAFENYNLYGQLRLIATNNTVLSTGISHAAYTGNLSQNGGLTEEVWTFSKRSYLADVITLASPTDFYMQQYVNSTGGISLSFLAVTTFSNLTEATPLHLDTLEILKLS